MVLTIFSQICVGIISTVIKGGIIIPKKYNYEEYLGKTINKLTINSYDKVGNFTYFNCSCKCGGTKRTIASNVILGKTTSCGCVQREKSTLSHKKYNQYDLTGEYGIGWTTNTNKEFYFDLEDYDKIKNYCWSENDSGYLRANDLLVFSNKNIRMHRLIMEKLEDDGLVIDHINHNTLDNRKHNLRICTESDNGKNKSLPSNNTSGIVGVSFNKKYNKYETYITIKYKRKFLGLYDSIEDAIKARKQAEEKYFGEYSYGNSMKYSMENESRKDD